MSVDIEFNMDTEGIINKLAKISTYGPEIIRKHFKKVGKNMTKTIKKTAKKIVKVGKKQKNPRKKYHNRFKTSRVIKSGESFAVGTYNSSPHAHLIEYGHKSKQGFVSGKYPIKIGISEYEKEVAKDLEEMLENVIKEGRF